MNSTTTIYVTDADNLPARSRGGFPPDLIRGSARQAASCSKKPALGLDPRDGSTGQILRRYVYGNGIDEALSQIEISNTSGSRPRATLIPDIQGSTLAALDSTSAALTKRGYLPFGESGSATGSYRYTGRRIDGETGGNNEALYYYRARTYSPRWGRFLQPDPIGYAGGTNLYAYVGNDPLNATDPNGEFCVPCAFAIGGAAVALAVQAASDYNSGKLSSFGTYAGVAASGAIGGLSLMLGGGVVTVAAIGGAGGLAGNVLQQGIDSATGVQQGFNVTSAVTSTVAGAGAAAILKPFAGVIANEYTPVVKSLITRFENGTISQVSPQTAAKMVGNKIVTENAVPEAVLGDQLRDLGNDNSSQFTIGRSEK